MKNFNIFTLLIITGLFIPILSAQTVPKNIIVEHFTNTRCSACASRNPGFYNALNQNQEIIHIAFHPSAPYSSCLFSTQNKVQNDARPKFYGIFGSTPRFVINGEEKSGSQVSSSNVYNEFKNQTTPVNLKVQIAKFGPDEIEVSFDVTSQTDNTLGIVNYFIALVEDTVFYKAPNGEKIHRDVFRKSFTNDILPSFMIPQNQGNQFSFRDKLKTESNWDLSRIYAVVILTDSNKKVVQVAKSPLYNPDIISSADNTIDERENVNIFPNPVSSEFFFHSKNIEGIKNAVLMNSIGQKVMEVDLSQVQSLIDVSYLESGTYFLEVSFENRVTVQKVIKL